MPASDNYCKGGGIIASDVSRSWFAVLNNPSKHGYEGSPQEVCEQLKQEWIKDRPSRTGAWAYCISSQGLHHVHMVLEDTKAMRFTAIKKSYASGMHFEATKGNKKQAEDYIKKNPPFDESGETIEYTCYAGEITGKQGKRSDLDEIALMIEEGMTPSQIFDINLTHRKYERMIKAAYFAKRKKETPIHREVKVHFLVGESGSGKSYSYAMLCEEYGEEEIYFLTDYDNGGFDMYQGERILFMDEYKGNYPFSFLLVLLDKYKTQIHARYSNIFALWDEVYITSVFPPEELYKRMVEEDVRGTDKQQQLFRRITDITYCYRDLQGRYQRYTIPMTEYTRYYDLKKQATSSSTIQKKLVEGYRIVEDKNQPFHS